MGPQVQQHRNWGKDSTFHDQGDILPMCTTQVSRTNSLLAWSSHNSIQSMSLEEEFLEYLPALATRVLITVGM
jgi:hypothetical protein